MRAYDCLLRQCSNGRMNNSNKLNGLCSRLAGLYSTVLSNVRYINIGVGSSYCSDNLLGEKGHVLSCLKASIIISTASQNLPTNCIIGYAFIKESLLDA